MGKKRRKVDKETMKRAKWIVREFRRQMEEGKSPSFAKLVQLSRFRVIDGGKKDEA